MAISQLFKSCVCVLLPIVTGCSAIHDRGQECGTGGMGKRIYSYQNGDFGMDLSVRSKQFFRIRYGGGDKNTEDGFKFIPCSRQRVLKYLNRQERQKQKPIYAKKYPEMAPSA
ncbi:MAG: hypothetical protein JKY11_09295 [Alphaproteobacteria bacterium]|nr:hypothetical protein [Alphaproteobacteria bacterium]